MENRAEKTIIKVIVAILAVVAIVLLTVIGTYNSLVSKEVKVSEAMANIDTQLTRRAELIPNLVSTVKGFTEHETEVFDSVTKARENLLKATSVSGKAEASEEITSALGKLIAIAEAYPELKSDSVYIGLMDELAGTENRIAIARESYNKAAAIFNKSLRTFPSNIIAGMLGYNKAELFEASESAKEVPSVEF